MDDLYKTTEEQKIRLYEIAETMRLHGLDSFFVEKAVEVAEYYEGAFDLFCLWANESDENERMNILDYLKREIVEFDNDRANFGCLHSNLSLKEVEKKLFDLSFITESLVCNKCGAILRGKEFEEKYNFWLEELYKDSPEKFQIVCRFSRVVIESATKILSAFPGTTIDALVKAIVVTYFNVLDRDNEKSIQFNFLLEADNLKLFVIDEDAVNVSIHFKPKLMIELISVSESFNIGVSSIVEEIVTKFMAMYSSSQTESKEFWRKDISNYLEMLLLAS